MTGWEGAYCGPPPVPVDLLWRWNVDPVLLVALTAVALWAGRSRAGLAATAVLVLAFVSPLCALSSALFSARVAHHILMVAVAAPLLALARPTRRTLPVGAAFLLATAALWAWHAPQPYDAALAHKAVYALMQVTLLGTAVLFWQAVLAQPGAAGAPWVLLAYVAMGMLGALLTFAPAPLYDAHAVAPWLWGFAPIQDQQLAGLLMWVPAGIPYAVLGALLARRAFAALADPPATAPATAPATGATGARA